MNRSTNHRQPTIHSPGARRLAAYVCGIRRRDPNFDDTIEAIRGGDNHALHVLVTRAQSGDADAAVRAIWALLPRLAAVVIDRSPISQWQPTMDDYLSFTYLTLVDVDLTAPIDHLSDKIVARTRRRFERSTEKARLAVYRPEHLAAVGQSGDDVEKRALARAQLGTLVSAVNNGLLDPDSWQTLLEVRFTAEPGTTSVRDRKAASRARIRLRRWVRRGA